ncbi:MAG: DUF4292 domain-containing protein [Deltaproteobacteria bacterium]|nr:DUF4292 domain-containing protein [Deltaproteobacteria bacterium]
MHEKKSFSLVLLLLLPFLACSCVNQTVIYSDIPTAKINNAISGSIDESDVISAIAKIDLITPDGYYPAKAVLIIKKPSYLRLELLPIIGTPDFFITVSPEKMSVFIPSKGEFYRGQPTQANLAKFLPWQINVEDIVMIFSGTFPSLRENEVVYQGYQEKNLLRVEMKTKSGLLQTIWIEEKNRLRKLVRNDKTGKKLYTVEYIYDEPPNPVPGKITINMADGITSLSIKYSDIKIEKAADLSIFDLPVPDDVKTITLDKLQ